MVPLHRIRPSEKTKNYNDGGTSADPRSETANVEGK